MEPRDQFYFYKIKLNVSFWLTRDFNEENYLGEAEIDLDRLFEKPE